MNKDRVVQNRSDKKYTENDGEKFSLELGDAWRTEFTASLGVASKMKGVRATLLAHGKGVAVTCHCSESDWGTRQPVFVKILDGMKPGDW